MFRSLVASDVGGALGGSEILSRRGFNACAFLLVFFSLKNNARNNYLIPVDGRKMK